MMMNTDAQLSVYRILMIYLPRMEVFHRYVPTRVLSRGSCQRPLPE